MEITNPQKSVVIVKAVLVTSSNKRIVLPKKSCKAKKYKIIRFNFSPKSLYIPISPILYFWRKKSLYQIAVEK